MPSKVYKDINSPLTEYTYSFSRFNNNDNFSSSSPNSILTKSYRGFNGTSSIMTKSYLNSAGAVIQNQTYLAAFKTAVSAIKLNNLMQPKYSYNPYVQNMLD